MKAVRIEGGVVTNVAIFDDESDLPEGWQEIGNKEAVEIDSVVNDQGGFEAPPRTSQE